MKERDRYGTVVNVSYGKSAIKDAMNSTNIGKTQAELTESDRKLIANLERTELHLRFYYFFSACSLLVALGLAILGPIIGSEATFLFGMFLLMGAAGLLGTLRNGSGYLKLIHKLLRDTGQADPPEANNKQGD
ncbi:MAG: hypothetical protein ABSC38_06345 [Verrucomicrobiia bacterium]